MSPRPLAACVIATLAVAAANPASAAPSFVNGLAIPGATLDASGGTLVNDGRMGFFSDLYYDPNRGEWWALSDRGPGGGTIPYETRVHRIELDVDRSTGAISGFEIKRTVIFRKGATALDGFAPPEAGPLGFAFDPEGIVVNPRNGHFLVSDEYGPSLLEFNRSGRLVRRYELPKNVLPRNAANGVVNHANDTGNTAGKRTNRGFEGLAISPDGKTAYAMLQSAMLDEGGSSGVWSRIVAFDTRTARPLKQFAYKLETSAQGRGISALVALNETDFLVLERNNRGLGVDATLTSPQKLVFKISLAGASDVTAVNLATATSGSFTPVAKEATPWLNLADPATLADPSLAALGGVPPEKFEGLTVGPRLRDGSYLVVAGTDNDYSVTQNGSNVQFDRYFKVAGGVVSRIQCDLDAGFRNCVAVQSDGSVAANAPLLPANFDYAGYQLIPGVLHAYKAVASDLAGFVRPFRFEHDDDDHGHDDREHEGDDDRDRDPR